jgi:hypothetical protein
VPESHMPTEALIELELLAKAATPGPWDVLSDPTLACSWLTAATPDDQAAIALFDYRPAGQNMADAQFAAHARTRVPLLINEVRALRTRIQELLDANSREVERRIKAQRERDLALARLKAAEGARQG